jgi:predicted MFS family arabinose efflux permease
VAHVIDLPASALPLAEEPRLVRDGDRHRVTYRLRIPYFSFLWAPLLARRARAIEAAADAGRPLPSGLPWWAPPVPQDARATATVACACLISGAWSYAGGTGGLLTQTVPYAAEIYDVGDSALGTGLAVVRVGIVLALVLAIVADRIGRRQFVVAAAVAHCLLAAVIGLAPSFAVYIGAHVLLRCIDTALAIALGVIALESVPAANRATTLALVLLANGVGLALAVGALPIAAAGEAGFAAAYALQLLGLPLVIHAGRRLGESPRYLAHAREPHRYRELLVPPYRRRVVFIGAASLLAAAFAAPSVEFLNRYLDDVHGYSSFEIVAFLAIAGTPSFAMLVVGGRLADFRSRKGVGVPLLLAGTAAFVGFYLADGAWLWILFFLAAMLSSAGGAALAPYRSELFPTRVRAAANAVGLTAVVAGSAIGLVLTGVLADGLGVGESIALLGVGPLVAAAIVIRWFPETARRELEDTSAEQPAD